MTNNLLFHRLGSGSRWQWNHIIVANRFPQQYNNSRPRPCQQRSSSIGSATKTHVHTHQAILDKIHPEHLFRIINDVDKYHQFLPYCTESRVLQYSACGTMYDAVLRVGLPGLSSTFSSTSVVEERYISRVRMISPTSTILNNSDDNITPMTWTVEAKSIQSKLFDSLKSRWQLTLVNNDGKTQHDRGAENKKDAAISCSVKFVVEIQVSNPLVSLVLDQVLKDVAKKQVDAFERRGNEIPF